MMATLGSEYELNNLKLYDLVMKVRLYDNPGQKLFRSTVLIDFKRADSIILIYDISRRETFEECEYYFKTAIEENCQNNVKVLLIGNKNDLEEKREVTSKEGYEYALKNNYLFIETSCFNNENVYEAIEKIIFETNLNKVKEKLDPKKNKPCQIF
jgi:small GTP-binding protein